MNILIERTYLLQLVPVLLAISYGRAQLADEDSSGVYELGSGNIESKIPSSSIEFHPLPQHRINKNSRETRINSIPKLLSYYKSKVFPDKLDQGVAAALEDHIEEMEPKFRSASFAQLWHALRGPLTEVFRPKRAELLLEELARCIFGNITVAAQYKLPTLVLNIRRDLVICKIGQILQGGKSNKQRFTPRAAFRQLWKLLRDPITPVFLADLRTLIRELSHYSPKFELAGIEYKLPGKMPDIRRDVAICQVDDVFNELYDNNFQQHQFLKIQKPEYFP